MAEKNMIADLNRREKKDHSKRTNVVQMKLHKILGKFEKSLLEFLTLIVVVSCYKCYFSIFLSY